MSKYFKALVLAVTAFLILTMSVGLCAAYFTDYEEAKGGAVLRLSGQTEVREEADDDGKVINIRNTGDSDVIVRVAVFGENMTESAGDDWIKGSDGFWYYQKILRPEGSSVPEGAEDIYQIYETSEIDVVINHEVASESGHDFDIIVVHESDRTCFDGSEKNVLIKPEGWLYPDIEAGGFREDN